MKLCSDAYGDPGGDLAKMPKEVFAELLNALVSANLATSGMLSSVNPQKIPFACKNYWSFVLICM